MTVGEIVVDWLKNVLKMEEVQRKGKRLKMTWLLVLASISILVLVLALSSTSALTLVLTLEQGIWVEPNGLAQIGPIF